MFSYTRTTQNLVLYGAFNRIAAYVDDAAHVAAVGFCTILAGHWLQSLQVIFLGYVLTSYRQRDDSKSRPVLPFYIN